MPFLPFLNLWRPHLWSGTLWSFVSFISDKSAAVGLLWKIWTCCFVISADFASAIAYRTGVIFSVFLANRGESEASAKRELGASAMAPRRQLRSKRQLGKCKKKLHVADESYWTVSLVQFTEQFKCESICCWFKSPYLILLRLRKTFEDQILWSNQLSRSIDIWTPEQLEQWNADKRNFFRDRRLTCNSHFMLVSCLLRFCLCLPEIHKQLRLFCRLRSYYQSKFVELSW